MATLKSNKLAAFLASTATEGKDINNSNCITDNSNENIDTLINRLVKVELKE